LEYEVLLGQNDQEDEQGIEYIADTSTRGQQLVDFLAKAVVWYLQPYNDGCREGLSELAKVE
jgi:hypothetical protein